MATTIFVNLPVRSLPKSVAFFTKLGFTFNAQFTDETTTCRHGPQGGRRWRKCLQ
jgi:predicted lactoylglutathione lyase